MPPSDVLGKCPRSPDQRPQRAITLSEWRCAGGTRSPDIGAANLPPLSKQETADRIGVSLRTLNRMMMDHRNGDTTACPPWYRLRGRVQFDQCEVDAWLRALRRRNDGCETRSATRDQAKRLESEQMTGAALRFAEGSGSITVQKGGPVTNANQGYSDD